MPHCCIERETVLRRSEEKGKSRADGLGQSDDLTVVEQLVVKVDRASRKTTADEGNVSLHGDAGSKARRNARHGGHLADERVDEAGTDTRADLPDGDLEACRHGTVSDISVEKWLSAL